MTTLEPFIFNLTLDEGVKSLPNEELVTGKNLRFTFEVNDELVNLFHQFGFSRRGARAWTHPTAEAEDRTEINRFFRDYISTFKPGTLFARDNRATGIYHSGCLSLAPRIRPDDDMNWFGYGHNIFRYYSHAQAGPNNIADVSMLAYRPGRITAAVKKELAEFAVKTNAQAENPYNRHRNMDADWRRKYDNIAGLTCEIVNGTFWIRGELYETYLDKDQDTPIRHISVFPGKNQPTYMTPQAVAELIRDFRNHEKLSYVLDRMLVQEDQVANLVEFARTAVTVTSTPGRPAEAIVRAGVEAERARFTIQHTVERGETGIVPLAVVLRNKHKVKNLHIDPSVVDVASMVNAGLFTEDDRLRPFQKEAVGLHLSTKLGYVNACEPGMGKTVMQLTSMRKRASETVAYRGLIVCETNLREQWTEEAAKWFPEAKIVTVFDDSHATKGALLDAMIEAGPVIVILAYSFLLRVNKIITAQQEWLDTFKGVTAETRAYLEVIEAPETTPASLIAEGLWHDIAADEATVIRTGSSKQNEAMWHLRRNSEVAVALIGTPINKEVQDLLRLVAWVRGDRRMFAGIKVDELYDLGTVEGARGFFESFGPLVFRRDKSEVANEMPKISENGGVSIMLSPTDAEKALADAAERELKRCYLELAAALDEVEATEDNAEAIAEAKKNLQDARGAWLGGTQLARMACSDPESLNASESVGAALLRAQGLMEQVLLNTPTKRQELLNRAQAHVEKGEVILVFTEFASVAKVLVNFLRDNGLRAEGYMGGNNKNRDQHRLAFQNGDIDVLVCTRAGERGLTLHRANAIYNFDLPWALERVVQRSGRALRIGSKNETVGLYYLILEGTIDERVAENIVRLGSIATMVLDSSRGIDVANTETGKALGGLVKSIGGRSTSKSILEMGRLLWGDEVTI